MAYVTFVEKLKSVVRSKLALCRLNKDRQSEYLTLKPKQFDALQACVIGDCICVLRTGYGKSLIYELIPYYNEVVCSDIKSGVVSCSKCVVLIITPLNSIIDEQCTKLGHRCIRIDSTVRQLVTNDVSRVRIDERLQLNRLVNCDFQYVIGLPEDVVSDEMLPVFKGWKYGQCVVVVDEGHCVVHWSEFRPKYGLIKNLRPLLPSSNVLVLTATASSAAQDDISTALLLAAPVHISGPIDRENICINVVHFGRDKLPIEEVFAKLMQPFFTELRDNPATFPKTVVYCKLHYVGIGYERAVVLGLAGRVGMYHAHLPDDKDDNTKSETAAEMKRTDGKLRLLFATEAYSMGTDVEDIRRVIHFGPPSSIEVYVQEVGRCGRDNLPATASLYYQNSDISSNVKNVSDGMKNFCLSTACRRMTLLAYFDQQPSFSGCKCRCCDVCRLVCDCIDCAL